MASCPSPLKFIKSGRLRNSILPNPNISRGRFWCATFAKTVENMTVPETLHLLPVHIHSQGEHPTLPSYFTPEKDEKENVYTARFRGRKFVGKEMNLDPNLGLVGEFLYLS